MTASVNLSIIDTYRSVLLLFLVVLIHLVEYAEDLDEEVEQIDEESEGMVCHVSVATFSLLHDHLSVKDHPEASDEEATHQVPETKCITAHEEP